MVGRSAVDGVMHEVCRSKHQLKVIFTLSMVGVGLMLLWAPFVDPDTGTGAIVLLNLAISSCTALFVGFFLWRCRVRAAAD